MITNCPVCGKGFDVLWPQLWRYRRGQLFICSWKCLRLFDDGKEGKGMGKLTLEIKKKAVQTAIDGGDPLKYLADCGYTAPDKMWYYIKNTLKEKDPELFAKIPDLRKGKKPEIPEPVSGGPWEKAETPEANRVEVVETPESAEPKALLPATYDGMVIREVEGLFGRYRYSGDLGRAEYIDFENADGMDTLSLTVDQWKKFREEQVKAALILGVRL